MLQIIDFCNLIYFLINEGIDDDEVPTEETPSASVPDEIPPLEGDGEDDASRMEEVD